MPSVHIILFARYAEVLGTSQLDVSLDEGATVAHVVGYLRGLPGGNSLPEQPFVAVNMEQARFDRRLVGSDEVAVLPPMAGG